MASVVLGWVGSEAIKTIGRVDAPRQTAVTDSATGSRRGW
jgi:hypothetical protein